MQNLYLLSPHLSFGSYFSNISYSEISRFITEIDNFEDITERWELSFDIDEDDGEKVGQLTDGQDSETTIERIKNYFKTSTDVNAPNRTSLDDG